MNHSEFFRKFYLGRCKTGLNGCRSKHAIVEFFYKNSVTEDIYNSNYRTEETRLAWFNEDRNPSEMWAVINKSNDFDKLPVAVLNALKDSALGDMMTRFGIKLKSDTPPDKVSFANAVAAQFIAIAKGHGEAKDCCASLYMLKNAHATFGDFATYLQGAVNRYDSIKILGEDEYPLYDYFVCNRIGRVAAPFFHRSASKPIEDATLEKLLTFDPRMEARHILLIGNGGIGKTLMLHHLFLESAKQYNTSGLLPILIELRNFSYYRNDIMACIIGAVRDYEQTFDEEKTISLLTQGRCQILLDGLDELDSSDVNLFQHKLTEFISRYPNNQIIITSRDCDAIRGISHFVRLYIQPFDNDQSLSLIDKLLADDIDATNAKKKILDYMENGFIKKDGIFASNPMLLTFIVRHHHSINNFINDKCGFYEMVYTAIVEGHDSEKEAYDRFFKSVDDAEEFTKVFREFCGLSYGRGLLKFNNHSFEQIFNSLTAREKINNPSKCKKKAFQHDACSTACMMYEQETGIYYIDPGFQEYLFAVHYYHADKDSTVAMGQSLWAKPLNTFNKFDAFDMLFQMSREKVEVCLYLPYLESIFKDESDESAFEKYVCQGYGQVKYSVTDNKLVQRYMKKLNLNKYGINLSENEPCNVIHYLILRTLQEKTSIKIETENPLVRCSGQEKSFIAGIQHSDNSPLDELCLEIISLSMYPQEDDMIKSSSLQSLVVDGKGTVISFGNEYEVKLNSRLKKDRLTQIVDMIRQDADGVYDTFLNVKNYYEEISERQNVNQFM